ncbi:MAG TPA: 50S ribosomal protein L10 [Bacteroidales bacterium]|nr:50S ribosomal protein L10 [Bacteroidales bacterium]HQB21357.1 50S ribosomal protein L10 [Bacteroidales bacterium]
MKREDKNALIESLKDTINEYNHFYLTDISGLNAVETFELRKKCFEKGIELIVVKNTFFKQALERSGRDFQELYGVLKENTTVMFTNVANVPGKLIQELNKKSDKPLFKGAYAEESFYIGADQLSALASLKSKEELIGDIILLLQSPIKTVLGQLESGKNLLGGLVKTLSERE